MRINFFLIFVFFFCRANPQAQKVYIDGFVYDGKTGEKISYANVYIPGLKIGTATNEYGYYSLQVPVNRNLRIVVGYAGYQNVEKEISLDKSTQLNFSLMPDNSLDAVTLEVKKTKNYAGKTVSSIHIPVVQIKKLPSLGGEPDLMKAFQLMPGVSSGKEGSSNLYVRGGSPDQNLILLDDVPLYYVNHLGGFVSVFNIDAIQNVRLLKGGFPARYGNRLSSVVDVRMKEGNRMKKGGSFSIGLLNAKIMREAPINDKMSYMISARRFLYDLISVPVSYIGTEGSFVIGYNFYDINAKINYEINDKHHLYFSIYKGDDHFYTKIFAGNSRVFKRDYDSKSKYSKKWGNQLAALRWHYVLGNRTDMISVLSYSKYEMYIGKRNSDADKTYDYQNYFKSQIQDLSLKSQINTHISNHYKILTGAGFSFYFFDPATKVYKVEDDMNNTDINDVKKSYKENALDAHVYMENHFYLWQKLKLNLGVRVNDLILKNQNFLSFEPRLNFELKLNKNAYFTAGYAQMQQNLHLLTTTGMGMPLDLWLPATSLAPPEHSTQFDIGFSKDLKQKNYRLSLGVYFKTMTDLIAYKPGKDFRRFNEHWEEIVVTGGEGKAYGLEVLLQKKSGKHTGWLSYTLSKSTRRFDEINHGAAYPFSYDRRHDFSVVYNFNFKKNIKFSAVWQYSTGLPFTLPVSKYYAITDIAPYYGTDENEYYPFGYDTAFEYLPVNGMRMKDFHRLDIGVDFIKQKKKTTRVWNISIINVYNRHNPYFYYIGSDEVAPGEYKRVIKQVTLFPFFPSFSYSKLF